MFSDECKHVSCLLKTRFALAENAFSDVCKKAENAFSNACKCVSRLLKSTERHEVSGQTVYRIVSPLIALMKDQVQQMTERRECVVCCRG